jgi:hypothetical protein
MKQAESRRRYLYGKAVTGLILAVIVAVLGACAGAFDEDSSQIDPAAGTTKGTKAGEMVKVKVRTASASLSRSMAVEGVERFVTYYEAIFKTKDGVTPVIYYRGVAPSSEGTIIIDFPIGNEYEVLLLAGTNNKTLLAAGHVPSQNILPNIANIVQIDMEKLPLQWNTLAYNSIEDKNEDTINDFEFSFTPGTAGSGAPSLDIDETTRFIKVVEPKKIVAADTITLTVNLSRLETLFKADNATTATTINLTLEAGIAKLWPRYTDGQFPPVPFAFMGRSIDTPTKKLFPSTVGLVMDTADPPNPAVTSINFVSDGPLPDFDVEGSLEFELKYHAFGTRGEDAKDSRGASFTSWSIRNGLNPTAGKADDSPEKIGGGLTGRGISEYSDFPVKFGTGGQHTVEIPTGYYRP